MKTSRSACAGALSVVVALLACVTVAAAAGAYRFPPKCNITYDKSFARSSFPSKFQFGVATAAFQVEGGTAQGGRGASIWDIFQNIPGKIANGDTAVVADNSYHKYKTDIRLLKRLGVTTYRFSLSWSRIQPLGTGAVNPTGIAYYNHLINDLLAAGISPAVTMYHWDLPNALEKSIGGWLNRGITDLFAAYADICFQNFGDRVKTWITLNEPQTFALQGYAYGSFAPGRCSDRSSCPYGNSSQEPYTVGHFALLAHAKAVQVYRSKYQSKQGGRIGISLDCTFLYPRTNSPADKAAAQRGILFAYGWFADPIVFGSYPPIMQQLLGPTLFTFSPAEVEMLKGSADFLGLNQYTANYASGPGVGMLTAGSSNVNTSPYSARGKLIGAATASPWLHVTPTSIYSMTMWIKNRYPNYPIYITENGVSNFGSDSLKDALCDLQRVKYFQSYLKNLLKAIKRGANVQRYYAWSLLDNFEWASGYTQRFGIHHVDFSDPKRPRTPKASAAWWSTFLRK